MTRLDDLVQAGMLHENQPLAPLTTYKFGGPAAYLATVETPDALRTVVEACVAAGLPLLALGRGSNLVVADSGFEGLVVRMGSGMAWIEVDVDGVVSTGAGAALPLVARTAVRHDRGGLEFLVGIPGSVGGAVAMNAGCHGSETRDWLITADVLDTASGVVTARTPDQLDMSYRHSAITADHVVVTARWSTTAQPAVEGEARIREITRWRKETQPGGTFNAGSVFKNPSGDYAGRIIDELGLKGHRVGSVSVSERHGNFFVADPGARAQDVYDLVAEVRSRVGEATGVDLIPEIRFVGDFDGTA